MTTGLVVATVYAAMTVLAVVVDWRPPTPRDANVHWNPGPGPHEGPLVYIARRRGTDEVKVGFTARVAGDRIAEWATGVAGHVDLEAVILGDQRLERDLHRALRPHRIHNEWFRLPEGGEWRSVVEGVAHA